MLILKEELPSLEHWRGLIVRASAFSEICGLHHRALVAVHHAAKWQAHLEMVEAMMVDRDVDFEPHQSLSHPSDAYTPMVYSQRHKR